MRYIVAASVALAVFGCASSGPIKIGKDTFLITKQSAGGAFVSSGSIKAELIKEGSTFCQGNGQVIQLTNSSELSAAPGRMPSAEIQFMCVSESQAKVPSFQKSPDTVIEVRTR